MNRVLRYCYTVLLSTMFLSCSTTKNSAGSRLYHATVTRYNIYHNGYESFKEGRELQEKSIVDNYRDILKLNPISDTKAQTIGTDRFDIAIEKAQKGIKLHSITAKPTLKRGKTVTEKEKLFLNKNEYNPFMWRTWMLFADAQMHKGEFVEAASTYTYISHLFYDEPLVVSEALIKMAQCYSEIGWNYESDELFDRIEPVPHRLRKEYAFRRASHLLANGRYSETIPLLEEAIDRRGVSKLQRIREGYLLAQLYKATGRESEAYKAFQKVINMNPPYIIEFYARIQQTEIMPIENREKMIKRLKRMERDPNNRNYIDQIYYALGNIHLIEKDTTSALATYEYALQQSKKSSPEKGLLLLTMANIYWECADYTNAGRCYSQAIGLINSDIDNYNTIKLRSEVLDELAGYTEQIQLQDSLQHLATLSEDELLPIIDGLIERAKLAATDSQSQENSIENRVENSNRNNGGDWYFYNDNLVQNGKQGFAHIWGNRKLEDNWRRINKTTLSVEDDTFDSVGYEKENSDDILNDTSSSITPLNDPFSREYYIQNIPYKDEQIRHSNNIISDALLNVGMIYKNRLTEYPLAEEQFQRIINYYADSKEGIEAYYQLYLMYSLWGKHSEADSCRANMLRLYPTAPLTIAICNPDFEENARYGKHREDSLYAATYQAYLDSDTEKLIEGCQTSAKLYPLGAHRAKFIFLEATYHLQQGNTNLFLESLQEIVVNYPENEISGLAGLIAQGMKDGRLLQSTSLSNVWNYREVEESTTLAADSTLPQFNADRYQPHLFVLAYPADSLNENQLLFEIARYNFTKYMVRRFDISFDRENSIGMMQISGFLSYDEAYTYMHDLYSDGGIAQMLGGIRAFIITPNNLELIFNYYSFNDYQRFYNENYLSIPELEINGITLFEEQNGYE